jgi:hypothetical protein
MLAFAMDWHVRLGSHEACLVKAMDVGVIDTVLRAGLRLGAWQVYDIVDSVRTEYHCSPGFQRPEW